MNDADYQEWIKETDQLIKRSERMADELRNGLLSAVSSFAVGAFGGALVVALWCL